jgi:NADH:ubiquinone oxidoreductase subunit E
MPKVVVATTDQDLDLSNVHKICQEHAGKRGDLLIVMQKIQGIFGYVPKPTLEIVAQNLAVTTSEIFGVLTFYNRFKLSPQGKHTIRACRGTACHFKGAPSIIESIRNHLHLPPGEDTTEDHQFSLEEVACLGACGIAPVMTIGEDVYGSLTPALATEAITRYLESQDVTKGAEQKSGEIGAEKTAS